MLMKRRLAITVERNVPQIHPCFDKRSTLKYNKHLHKKKNTIHIGHTTRGSREPVINHLVFNLTSKCHSKISTDSFFFAI